MFIVVKKKFILGIFSALFAAVLIMLAVYPPKNISVDNLNPKTVVIDAGHGGMDGGSVGEGNIPEKNINLEIALKLEEIFKNNGYNVIMTRETDVSLHENDNASVRNKKTADLKKRAEIANSSNASLFISVHANKYESPDIFGSQVFYSKNDERGKIIAESVMERLRELNPKNKRLAKPLPNPNLVFKNLKIPGILIECGFMSNPDDLKNLMDDTYRQKTAEAIYNGIINAEFSPN